MLKSALFAAIVGMSGCASFTPVNLLDPNVKVGMSEKEVINAVGMKPTQEESINNGKVLYWAEIDTFSGRIHAIAYAFKDGKVINDPSLVPDKVPNNLMERYWD